MHQHFPVSLEFRLGPSDQLWSKQFRPRQLRPGVPPSSHCSPVNVTMANSKPKVPQGVRGMEGISQTCTGLSKRRNKALRLATEIAVFLVCGFCCYCSLAELNPGECTWLHHSPLILSPLSDTSLVLACPAPSLNIDCLPRFCP